MSSTESNVGAGPSTPRPDATVSVTGPAGASASAPKPISPPRQVPTVLQPLQYVGIPKSVLSWKPRMPSRNWSIFIGVTTTLTSLYIYDRRECKRISEEYKEKVRFLAEKPMHPREWPRKVMVYTSRSPGDDDSTKSLLFFKKYVKPVLVAAAIDWEILNGVQYGGLARVLSEKHYARRRQFLKLEPWGTPHSGSANKDPDLSTQQMSEFSLTAQQQLDRELDGGVVIVGRPALKEWAWALKKGWSTPVPPARQDPEEDLAQILGEDGAFDEVVDEKAGEVASETLSSAHDEAEPDGAGAPLPSRIGTPGPGPMSFNPAFQSRQASPGSTKTAAAANVPNVDPRLLEPPEQIPAQPPLCFVDYVNLTGFRNVPRRMVGFFTHRHRVRQGGQAALEIALGTKQDARDFDAVLDDLTGDVARTDPPQGGDLDWGLAGERFYPPRFAKLPAQIAKERKQYYDDLPRRLRDTRTHVRGERELTATERGNPPKSEGDLRQERFNREREWRNDLMGYEILRTDAGVAWHRAFRGALRVFKPVDFAPMSNEKQNDEFAD